MSIHIHLGAHKTASTHIQAILRKNRARLAAAGVVSIPPDAVRAMVGAGRRAAARMAPVPSFRAHLAGRRLARAGAKGARVILSDENSLGGCAEMVATGALYPDARPRLSVWRRLADAEDVWIYLSIRDYGAFFSGVHAQAVRNARYRAMAPVTLGRRWTDLAQEIRRAAPRARLIIWDYADYGALRPEIIRRLTGLSDLEEVHRRPMATPSAAAMAAMAAGQGWEEAIRDHPLSAAAPRYAPWNDAERAAFSAAFAEDLMALSAMDGVECLAP